MFWKILSASLFLILCGTIYFAKLIISTTLDVCCQRIIKNKLNAKIQSIDKADLLVSYQFGSTANETIYDFSRYEELGVIGITESIPISFEEFYENLNDKDKEMPEEMFHLPSLYKDAYILKDMGGNISWVPHG